MYIQVTTRCNMSCDHCCFACGANGKDMTAKTFHAALALIEEDDEASICIGGGEPTLHPCFWPFLIDAIAQSENVWLATNGSITKTALRLAQLAKRGVIGCALSQDCYHDSIDCSVIKAFTYGMEQRRGYGGGINYKPCDDNDKREIRDVTQGGTNYENLSPFRDPEDGGNPEHCSCGGVFIAVNGNVKPCGCLTAPVIGHVSTFDLQTHLNSRENSGGCYRDEEAYSEKEQERMTA